MTQEKAIELAKDHGVSALITFATAFALEVAPYLDGATKWDEVTWGTVLYAASFVAARAVFREVVHWLVKRKGES